jgi:hypothetical protein
VVQFVARVDGAGKVLALFGHSAAGVEELYLKCFPWRHVSIRRHLRWPEHKPCEIGVKCLTVGSLHLACVLPGRVGLPQSPHDDAFLLGQHLKLAF